MLLHHTHEKFILPTTRSFPISKGRCPHAQIIKKCADKRNGLLNLVEKNLAGLHRALTSASIQHYWNELT